MTQLQQQQTNTVSKAQNLPEEILIQIFEVAPNTTVYQCIGVCKTWETAALEVFYQELSLDAKVVKFIKPILGSKKRTLPQVSPHLHLGRYLDVAQTHGRTLTQHEFSRFLTSMPYLKTVDFNTTAGFTSLKHLNNILVQQSSSNNTGEDASARSFGRVEEICYGQSYFFDQRHMKVLFGVCYALHESLTHLYMRLFESENQSRAHMQLLPQLKQLTHLTIDNGNVDQNAGDEYM